MLRHYLASAFASIARTPFTTAANILTLALGLACFIAAWGIVAHWRATDRFHANADRIVIITQTVSSAGEDVADRFNPASSATLARYIREDVAGVEHLARVFQTRQAAVAAAGSKRLLDAAYVDAGFLDIFSFEFIAGGRAAFLGNPNGVILTRSAAERLFGASAAIGQSLIVDNERNAVVTGVIAPVQQPSFMGENADALLAFEMIGHWGASPGGVSRDAQDVWLRSNALTFARLERDVPLQRFNQDLSAAISRRMPADLRDAASVALEAVPLSDLAMRRLDNDLLGRSGFSMSAASALVGLGVLILIIAAINYSNLSTAQAAARANEIGMRKILGAGRAAVMLQCWAEAMLAATVAILIALAMVALAAPAIQEQTGVAVTAFLSQGAASLTLLAGMALFAGLLAGAYPALVLSGIRPATALRQGRSRNGAGFIARVLVAVQFASASFLLILVIVTQLQRTHLERLAIDRGGDPIVVLNNLATLDVDEQTLKARLEAQPGIRSVTFTDRVPWSKGRAVVGFARSADAAAVPAPAHLKVVRHDYFETFGLPMLAGRAFSPAREPEPTTLAQTSRIVIDRSYAERLGFSSPQAAIGEIVHPGENQQSLEIIGVAEAEATRLEASEVSGHVYLFAQWRSGSGHYPVVRIAREDVAGAVSAIGDVWDQLAPNVPANVQFFGDLFARSFASYAQAGQVFALLSTCAFVISSIGMLGIAVHVASRRRREVAVRKTLGSSALRVVRLLLADFSRPVLVGNLLAWPIAWVASQAYLSSFSNRIDLGFIPFGLSLALTLLIAWLAVGGVVLKAASVRPAEVLRHA